VVGHDPRVGRRAGARLDPVPDVVT
jgi:hypothetical protein